MPHRYLRCINFKRKENFYLDKLSRLTLKLFVRLYDLASYEVFQLTRRDVDGPCLQSRHGYQNVQDTNFLL